MSDLRTNLQIPKNTKVLDDQGQMSLEWQKYFAQLQKSITGALEALETEYLNQGRYGDVRGGSALVSPGSVTIVGAPGSLAQGPVGEALLTITYLTGTPAAGQSSHTLSFTLGIETSHT